MFVFAAGYAGSTTNLQIVLNSPKTLFKSCPVKKYLPNIRSPQKSWNRKFQTPQKPFDHPRHFKSGVPPPRPRPGIPLL